MDRYSGPLVPVGPCAVLSARQARLVPLLMQPSRNSHQVKRKPLARQTAAPPCRSKINDRKSRRLCSAFHSLLFGLFSHYAFDLVYHNDAF